MLSDTSRGSKPRNNALHVVCCNETIYVSLRDATNKMFLNRTPHPRAVVHTPKKCAIVHPLQDYAKRNLGRFA